MSARSGPCRADCRSTALKDIDLNVRQGEFVAILGPSGCGKRTLLELIAGLEPLSSRPRHVRRQAGRPAPSRASVMVFQEHSLFPWLSVKDNVGFGLVGEGRAEAPSARRASRRCWIGCAGAVRASSAASALGRHETARRDCARAGGKPRFHHDGRAVRGARLPDPRADAAASCWRSGSSSSRRSSSSPTTSTKRCCSPTAWW